MTPENRRLLASASEPEKERQLWMYEIDGSLEYEIIVNGLFLMNSNNADTETLQVRHAIGLSNQADADVLIGGLGMGFAVRAACMHCSSRSSIDVVELDPMIIQWNKTMIDRNKEYLADPRVCVIQGDFIAYIQTTEKKYHTVCMDIDNGPQLLSYANNAAAYSAPFFHQVSEVLHEGGVFSIWSGNRDDQLLCDMSEAFRGFSVEEVYQDIQGKRVAYYLFFGIK